MVLKILIISNLLFIFFQDMRYRAVYWLAFPVLALLLAFSAVAKTGIYDILYSSSLNISFLVLQFLLVSIYFTFRNNSWVNLTSEYLGWGDILFLLCVAVYLSPGNYLLFYTFSLVVILPIAVFKQKFNYPKLVLVPLAGMQAFLLAGVLIFDWQSKLIDLSSDSWILKCLVV